VQTAIDALLAAIAFATAQGFIDPAADAAIIAAEVGIGIAESALFAAEVICHGSQQSDSYWDTHTKHQGSHISVTDSNAYPSSNFFHDPSTGESTLLFAGSNVSGQSAYYTIELDEDRDCDITMVGSGGGGSYGIGGGGGAGTFFHQPSTTLTAGKYILTAADGGPGGTDNGANAPGSHGAYTAIERVNSSDVITHDTYVYGGAGGASNTTVQPGGSGGGGDGHAYPDNFDTIHEAGTSAHPTSWRHGVAVSPGVFATDSNVIALSNNGSNGGNASGDYHFGGGGGGAGSHATAGATTGDGVAGVGGTGYTHDSVTYSVGGNGMTQQSTVVFYNTQDTSYGSGGNGGAWHAGYFEGQPGRAGFIKIKFHATADQTGVIP